MIFCRKTSYFCAEASGYVDTNSINKGRIRISYHHKTVMMWAENRQKPRLGALLVLSYRFGLRAIDLIASHLEEGPVMHGRVLPLCSVQRLKPTLHKHDINVL
jgi:hypothetical protein